MFVIQYEDGLFNSGLGFPVKLAEATRYETAELAQAECDCLMYDATVRNYAQVIAEPMETK